MVLNFHGVSTLFTVRLLVSLRLYLLILLGFPPLDFGFIFASGMYKSSSLLGFAFFLGLSSEDEEISDRGSNWDSEEDSDWLSSSIRFSFFLVGEFFSGNF